MKVLVFFLFLIFGCNVNHSYAVTFGVNTLTDTPDMTPGDGVCQDASGNCSLRAAVQEANALAGADQINVPTGIYLLTLIGAGEDACASGDLDITSDITIAGASSWTTFIDGNRSDRIFHVLPLGQLTLTEIYVTGGLVAVGYGGGLLNEGNLDLSYCSIDTNACILANGSSNAGGFGGGLANLGTLMATNTTFESNVAQGAIGQDAKNGGAGGGSTPGMGGAVYNENGATATLLNCTLSANRALGGMASRGATNGGSFSQAGSPGAGPSPGGGGAAGGGTGGNGGIYSGGGGGGSSCTTGGNGGNGGYGAGGGGRGARSCSGSSGNVGTGGFGAGNGNGSCCSSCGGGGAGAGFGGALFNNGGTVIITSSTIAFNEALGGFGRTGQGGYAGRGLAGMGIGGGLFNRTGTMTLNNTIVSNNLADTLTGLGVSNGADQGDLFGTFTSLDGHNLVMTVGTAILGGNTTNNVTSQDPLLMPLSNNGGSNNTHGLDPCIPSLAINIGFASMALDQRNETQFLTPDIGAFELQDPCILLSAAAIAFKGERLSKHNLLEWETVIELNSDAFELYRSSDGITWELLTTIQGAGHSTIERNYSFMDLSPYPTISYYRLKWLLTDGRHSFTSVIALERSDKDDAKDLYIYKIYPSPTKDMLYLDIESGQNKKGTIRIFNAVGQLVLHHSLPIVGQQTTLQLDISALAAGVYTLVLESEDRTKAQVEKVIKQ